MKYKTAIFLLLITVACTSTQNKFVLTVTNGDKNAVQRYILRGYDLEKPGTWYPWGGDGAVPGRTPLTEAAVGNQIEIGEILIQAGANLETYDGFGQTALLAAAGHNQLEFVKLLLHSGANPNASSVKGSSRAAIKSAFSNRNTDMIRLLLEYNAQLPGNYQNENPYRDDEEFRRSLDAILLKRKDAQHVP